MIDSPFSSDDPRHLNSPWVESPFFETILEQSDATEQQKGWARSFRENGYLAIEGLIGDDLIDPILERYDWLFDPATDFGDAPEWLLETFRRDANRRQDAFRVLPAVHELACHPQVLDVLRLLYGREPIPFQTLNFLRGTQQPVHSDAMHFASLPGRFMAGVWVALEDVDEANGTLCYYPGSHRLPEIRVDELCSWGEDPAPHLGATYQRYEAYLHARLELAQLPLERLRAPKGTVLIWASNLAHGGGPIGDPRSTRKSQVTHFFFEDCIYYTPIFSNPVLGEYFLREIYDVRTGRHVPHRLNGVELAKTEADPHRFRLSRPLE